MNKRIYQLMGQLGIECENLGWIMIALILSAIFTELGDIKEFRLLLAGMSFITSAAFYCALRLDFFVYNADLRGIIWFVIGILELLVAFNIS